MLFRSPGFMAIPAAAASMGDRPVKYRLGSHPKMDRMAVSLPAGRGGGQLTTLPTSPLAAIRSMAGVGAAWRGVLFPSWGTGSSAIPSPMISRYFVARSSFCVLLAIIPYPVRFFNCIVDKLVYKQRNRLRRAANSPSGRSIGGICRSLFTA